MRARVLLLLALCPAFAGCSARALPPSALASRAHGSSDPPTTAPARDALAFAEAQIGRRYCWGGTGPDCFDCSGLVQRAWATAGVRLPRTSTAMGEGLSDVPLEEVRAGDVLWWPGHVAIYAGDGMDIESLNSRDGVVKRPVKGPYRALRPVSTGLGRVSAR